MNWKHFSPSVALAGVLLLAVLPTGAQATLTYENVGGEGLLYDSATALYWTQDGNLSGENFAWADAQTWAAQLSYGGVAAGNWQIPNPDQFTSLFSQLAGTDHKYGAEVHFGIGPNDFAADVSTVYWTDADVTDFNFYYGYPGHGYESSDLLAAWAVTATTPVPEPSPTALSALSLLAGAGIYRRQRG